MVLVVARGSGLDGEEDKLSRQLRLADRGSDTLYSVFQEQQ